MQNLTFIVFCPLVAALVIALLPRTFNVLFRVLALGATFLSLLGALRVFAGFEAGAAGLQFEQQAGWIAALGVSYHVGVDGLNVGLLLMGALVAFAAACVSREITERQKLYYILLLLMAGGILGAFVSFDIFLFYVFHELALVPTFILIGVWGRGEQRNYATFQITLYLSLGALITLAGLIALYAQAGAATFNVLQLAPQLAAQPLTPSSQHVIFGLLLFGFGILVSLWPFHTWAPLGYAAAPTAAAMLHAGVLKKFGLYGLIRIALPLLPAGAQGWMHVLAWLCLGNILYCGLVAMRQRDLNLLLGNSSVAHMGFAFLGIASLSVIGVTGTVVVMIAHGLLAALSFAVSGHLQHHLRTVNLDQLGGLLRQLPFLGGVMVMAMFAGCGLPGFANFPGEALTLLGAWPAHRLVVILAAWGALIIAAVYMLRAVRALWHGPLPERWREAADAATAWVRLPFALLLAALVIFGCVPRLLTDQIRPVATRIIEQVHAGAPADKPALAGSTSTSIAGVALTAPPAPRPEVTR
jgi:NADH-quinone oxidoreductase subunit M